MTKRLSTTAWSGLRWLIVGVESAFYGALDTTSATFADDWGDGDPDPLASDL